MAGSRNRIGRVCGATRTNPSADEALAYQPRPPASPARSGGQTRTWTTPARRRRQRPAGAHPDCLTPEAPTAVPWPLYSASGSAPCSRLVGSPGQRAVLPRREDPAVRARAAPRRSISEAALRLQECAGPSAEPLALRLSTVGFRSATLRSRPTRASNRCWCRPLPRAASSASSCALLAWIETQLEASWCLIMWPVLGFEFACGSAPDPAMTAVN